MKEIINLVFRIFHVKASDLILLEINPKGFGVISYTSAFEIPISKSSVRFKISSALAAPGKSFDVTLSANLLHEIEDLAPGIYLVELENGDTYVIGTKDHLVRFNSDEVLNEKSFDIKYKSLQKPFKIAN